VRQLNALSIALYSCEMLDLLELPGSGCISLLEALFGWFFFVRVLGHFRMRARHLLFIATTATFTRRWRLSARAACTCLCYPCASFLTLRCDFGVLSCVL
jgi:hypothetical protein